MTAVPKLSEELTALGKEEEKNLINGFEKSASCAKPTDDDVKHSEVSVKFSDIRAKSSDNVDSGDNSSAKVDDATVCGVKTHEPANKTSQNVHQSELSAKVEEIKSDLTEEIKNKMKSNLQSSKNPVYTNITLNRSNNLEIITKIQKVSNKNGQPIGLNIIKQTVKKYPKKNLDIESGIKEGDEQETNEDCDERTREGNRMETKENIGPNENVGVNDVSDSSKRKENINCKENVSSKDKDSFTKTLRLNQNELSNVVAKESTAEENNKECVGKINSKEKKETDSSAKACVNDKEFTEMEVDDEKQNFFNSIELTAKSNPNSPKKQEHCANSFQISTNEVRKRQLNEKSNFEKPAKRAKVVKEKKSPKGRKQVVSIPKQSIEKEFLLKNNDQVPLSKNPTKSELQSLFGDCNINIPSSLSITLKEDDASGPSSLRNVQNYIEILKLPEITVPNGFGPIRVKSDVPGQNLLGQNIVSLPKEEKGNNKCLNIKMEPVESTEDSVKEEIIQKDVEMEVHTKTNVKEELSQSDIKTETSKQLLEKNKVPHIPCKVMPMQTKENLVKLNPRSPQCFQKMFEEAVKKSESKKLQQSALPDGSSQGGSKRKISDIASELIKKKTPQNAIIAEEVKSPPPGKLPIPRLNNQRNLKPPQKVVTPKQIPIEKMELSPKSKAVFQQTCANLHSPSLGMNYTVSVNQPAKNMQKIVPRKISDAQSYPSELKRFLNSLASYDATKSNQGVVATGSLIESDFSKTQTSQSVTPNPKLPLSPKKVSTPKMYSPNFTSTPVKTSNQFPNMVGVSSPLSSPPLISLTTTPYVISSTQGSRIAPKLLSPKSSTPLQSPPLLAHSPKKSPSPVQFSNGMTQKSKGMLTGKLATSLPCYSPLRNVSPQSPHPHSPKMETSTTPNPYDWPGLSPNSESKQTSKTKAPQCSPGYSNQGKTSSLKITTGQNLSRDLWQKDSGRAASSPKGHKKDVSLDLRKDCVADFKKDISSEFRSNGSLDSDKNVFAGTGKEAPSASGKDTSVCPLKDSVKNNLLDFSRNVGENTTRDVSSDSQKDPENVVSPNSGKDSNKAQINNDEDRNTTKQNVLEKRKCDESSSLIRDRLMDSGKNNPGDFKADVLMSNNSIDLRNINEKVLESAIEPKSCNSGLKNSNTVDAKSNDLVESKNSKVMDLKSSNSTVSVKDGAMESKEEESDLKKSSLNQQITNNRSPSTSQQSVLGKNGSVSPQQQTATALSTNQLLEKYNIQNLAQLTASFNFNPANGSASLNPTQIAAFQQAMILRHFELQNRQNWFNMNQNPLVQYEKLMQSLNQNQNHLLGKEN